MTFISSSSDVPALLRHCVVAVYNKSTSGQPDGVVRAFKICRDTLAKSGYLSFRGASEILEGIMLTGKGFERTLLHAREGFSGNQKDEAFDKLFKTIQPRLWEYDGPGGKQQPKTSTDGDAVGSDRADIIGDGRDANIIGQPMDPK